MRDEAEHNGPYLLKLIPDSFKTQEMSIKEVKEDPGDLGHVAYHFNTQVKCDNSVCEDPRFSQLFPDLFARLKLVEMCHDHRNYYDDDKLTEW